MKKKDKNLLVWHVPAIFKQYCKKLIRKLPYLYTFKKIIVENKPNTSDKLQMADILVADAKLSAFVLTMDENTRTIIDETKQKQDEVLKLKEVNEERLRMVVQL